MAEPAGAGAAAPADPPSVPKHHPVRQYVQRVASKDIEDFPQFDLKKPLPKLPIPNLSSTLQLYLEGIKPICSKEQYERTKAIVEEFQKEAGQGEFLQQKLQERGEAKDNWVYQLWLDDMYMKIRLPLPINSNVGMVFPRQTFEDQRDQLKFAAKFISGILDYKVVIDTKTLPVDRANSRVKGQPMCMEQYYRLFSSYRVPGIKKDVLVSSVHDNINKQETDHIIIICKNQLFLMELSVNGQRLSDDNIYAQLRRVMEMAAEGAEAALGERVGILTAADRDRWARGRMKLMEVSVNRDSLDLIERCIFIVCLDDPIPLSFNHQTSIDETNMGFRDDVSLATQMLHGFGTKVNSCNRWFDKTMQFVICADGACGLNYEHSPAEGIAVVQLIEHLLKYMDELKKRKLPRMQSICDLPAPRKLRWHVSDEMQEEITHAMTTMDAMINTLDLYVLRFNEFGKEFPKQHNCSPDAFIQLAVQLTFYKIHKKLVSTYESASIRRFRLGRVDVIRACTQEALDWARAMTGEVDASMEEKTRLFRRALQKQTDILVQTILGHGIDNHLLGLRETAVELGLPTPAIFADESYAMSIHFTVSTSQVPTSMDAFMCYGPVVPDGYGICYNPHPNEMVVAVTSFSSCGETRSDHFAFTLESSFRQMRELCEAENAAAGASGQPQLNALTNNNEAKKAAQGTNNTQCNGPSSQ